MLILASVAAAATLARPLSLGELVERSDVAVRGFVEGVHAEWFEDRIWSFATVGGAEVRVPGGCVEDLCLRVYGAPALIEGEEVVLFLRDGTITGFSQGFFRVDGDDAVGPSRLPLGAVMAAARLRG